MGVVIILIGLILEPHQMQQEHLMHGVHLSWFELAVDEHGNPTYIHSPKHTRAQREFLRRVRSVHELKDLATVESQLNAALAGREFTGDPFTSGGSWAFSFFKPGRAGIWSDFDSEGEGEGKFPPGGLELDIPLADFAELFRAWAASMRYWRSVGGYVGVPVPREKWPASYPPPGGG